MHLCTVSLAQDAINYTSNHVKWIFIFIPLYAALKYWNSWYGHTFIHPSVHLSFHPSLHPFIFCSAYRIQCCREPGVYLGDAGHKEEDTLEGLPIHQRSWSYITGNLVMPISLQQKSLNWWREPEYLKETQKASREHTNSAHRVEAKI